MAKISVHFDDSEFACNDANSTPVPDHLRDNLLALCQMLEKVRLYCGVSLHIVSGYRTPTHNRKVGGAKGSTHLTAEGADVRCKAMPPKELHATVLEMVSRGLLPALGGIGLYPGWVHLDTRKAPDGHLRKWTGAGTGSEP